MQRALVLLLCVAACGVEPPPTDTSEGALATGVDLSNDLVLLPPDPAARRTGLGRPGPRTVDGPRHILYVNFGDDPAPTMIAPGGEDSSMNQSRISRCAGPTPYPAYSGTQAQRDATLTIVRQLFQPFDIDIVTTRPTNNRAYTMCMVGGTPAGICLMAGGGVAGVAPLDCDNAFEGNVVYAFSQAGCMNNPYCVATTIAQEAAHAYGLGHTDQMTDIMYPMVAQNQTFMDQEMMSGDAGGFTCPAAAMTMTQNTFRFMINAIGPNRGVGPNNPPVVKITAPTSGQTGVSQNFAVTVTSMDDYFVSSLSIALDPGTAGARSQSKTNPRGSETVSFMDVPVGPHRIVATAIDSTMQQTVDTVDIGVGSSGADAGAGRDSSQTGNDPKVGDLCDVDGQCGNGGKCLTGNGGINFCSRPCSGDCPSGYSCGASSGAMYCLQGGGASSGGCSVAAPTDRGAPGALALAFALFALIRIPGARRIMRACRRRP